MKNLESAVISHYENGDLLARILGGLEASGADLDNLRPDDLAPVEEFHIGGRSATEYLVDKMALTADMQVLDIGCGIGGAARYVASHTGCRVTGIDLTPEYIAVANALSRRVRLDEQLRFEACSALAMPFDAAGFDALMTIHVAMNIADRPALYAEMARVAKPGATLGIYDVMKNNDEDLVFPVPWAESPQTSYLTTPDQTCSLLAEAGFSVSVVEDRTPFAVEFFEKILEARAKGPPALGTHLVMGKTARDKFANVLRNIETDRIAPVQVIATRQ